MKKIINIHIPKTGGTSFKKTLEEYYHNIKYDYGHGINKSELNLINEFNDFNKKIILEEYNNVDCIYGHFLPIKYKKLYNNDWFFITWLRNPAQRLYSQYFHFIRHNANFYIGNEIFNKEMLFEDFIFSPSNQNFYQRFFHNFPYKNYGFIGIIENYDSDIKYLSNLIGFDLKLYYDNINIYKNELEYKIEPFFLKKIQEHHSKDYELYNEILKTSNKRKC